MSRACPRAPRCPVSPAGQRDIAGDACSIVLEQYIRNTFSIEANRLSMSSRRLVARGSKHGVGSVHLREQPSCGEEIFFGKTQPTEGFGDHLRIAHTQLDLTEGGAKHTAGKAPRRSMSVGVVTIMSLLTGRSLSKRRISTAALCLSGALSRTTRRSTSLAAVVVPRACEPSRTTRRR